MLALLFIGVLPFDQYLTEAEGAFAKSPLAEQLTQSGTAQVEAYKERLAQSPFTFGIGGQVTWNQPYTPPGTFTQRAIAVTPNLSVSYLPRSGFAATLSGDFSYAILHAPVPPGSLSPAYPFNVGLNLSYELIQGGLSSTQWLQAGALAEAVRAQEQTFKQQTIDARISFLGLMTAVYTNSCKTVILSAARKQIDETIESAKIQLKAKIMSQRDYFNFTNLDSSFATQLIQLQADRAVLNEQVRAFGPSAAQVIASLDARLPKCDVDIAATQSLARARVIPEGELDKWASALPATRVAEAFIASADKNLAAIKKGLLPRLAPFVNVAVGQPDFIMQPTVTLIGGLNFTYNIPGARGDYATSEASALAASAHSQAGFAFLQSKATLRQLNAQLTTQAQVLDVLKRALENSELLIKTLEAQKIIGQLESLNFATAYLNNVSVRQSTVDAWGSVQSASYSRLIYEQAVNAAPKQAQ